MMLRMTRAKREDSVRGADTERQMPRRSPFDGAAGGCAKASNVGGKERIPRTGKNGFGKLPKSLSRKVMNLTHNPAGADLGFFVPGGAREVGSGGNHAG